jgi:predicted ATPase
MPSLWRHVTWVFDSRHPDELYKNGLQRGSFEPCIDMIKNKFQVIDLDSKTGKSYGPCLFPRQLSMCQKV